MPPVRNATPVNTNRPPTTFSSRPNWLAKPPRHRKKRPHCKGGEQERRAKADRIGAEQHSAARDRVFRTGNRQNGRKDRPDARRPAKRRRRGPSDRRSKGPAASDTSIRFSRNIAPMRNAPRKCSPIAMIPIPAAIESAWLHCRTSAPKTEAVAPQRDKDGGEAENEQERHENRVAPRPRFTFVDQLFQRSSREIAQIGRRQRQHAGA